MMPLKTELISKQEFQRLYPELHYGTVGDCFIVTTPDGKVCAHANLSFPGYKNMLKRFKDHALIEKPLKDKEPKTFLLVGTHLQQSVWKALLEIPRGETVSYLDLAIKIGKPKAYRAVANAVGANPISPLIPCHRVVRKGGALGGYYWGTEVKAKLLQEEGLALT
jgi:O-6-methylguanine DNA methyltransferase